MANSVTSHDVARLAGVSQPTVSRALRNLPGTSPETRQRVQDAARELSYIPSESGRILSTRRTRRIAIVAEELINPFYPELIEPIRQSLARHDYRTVLVTDDSDDPVSFEVLSDGSYDGVVLCTVSRRSTLPRDLTQRGVPHVLVNRTLDHSESSTCSFDNLAGARLLGEFLAELGHRRIGALQGPTKFSTGRERATGLRQGLKAHGLHIPREYVRRIPYTYADGYRAAAELLQLPTPPTALFCGNDVIAVGALAAAHDLGVDVPERLTVVGFDDIAMASWGLVRLTTIRCDLDALAQTSVELLLAAINGGPSREVRLAVRLVERSTHAGPPD
jgi:LacI family transcriptional regulator